MAAWDVDRCPVHGVSVARGRCRECRREANIAAKRIRAMSMPRDSRGAFAPVVHVPAVDDGDNQP